MFKRIFKRIKYWWTWMTSGKVQEAINNGMEYDEVEKIVWEEMQK